MRSLFFAPDYGFDAEYGQKEKQLSFALGWTRRKMENGMLYPKLVSRKFWMYLKEKRLTAFSCTSANVCRNAGVLYLGKKYQIHDVYVSHAI